MRVAFAVLLICGGLSAQETASEGVEKSEETFLVSCQHPVMNKAREEGLASLKWKEVPLFLAMSVRCKLQARQEGVDVPMAQLFRDKQSAQHNEAKNISGFGSCCITVTGLIVIYSLLGAALGAGK